MTARDRTLGAIHRECMELVARKHVSPSLHDLARYVSRLAGLGLSTVQRAFADHPSWFPLGQLLGGNVSEMTDEVTDPDRCSDLPGRPSPSSQMSEKRPTKRPTEPPTPTGGGPAAASPQVTPGPVAPPHAPANSAASTLPPPAAGGGSLSPTPSKFYRGFGRVTAYDGECVLCGGFVPAGEGVVLVPYPNRSVVRVLHNDDDHKVQYAAELVLADALAAADVSPPDDVPPPSPPSAPEEEF